MSPLEMLNFFTGSKLDEHLNQASKLDMKPQEAELRQEIDSEQDKQLHERCKLKL